jgi:hypothetical protein
MQSIYDEKSKIQEIVLQSVGIQPHFGIELFTQRDNSKNSSIWPFLHPRKIQT